MEAVRHSGPMLRTIELRTDKVPSFDVYPFSVPSIRGMRTIELTSRVTFFIGENGSGKSTLMEAVAVAFGFGPEGGSRNVQAQTTSSNAATRPLADALRLSWRQKLLAGYFLRAESFFNIATYIDDMGHLDSYGGVPLHSRSHGESFLALMQNRMGPGGFYMMDEPESALSPQRQLTAMVWMHDRLAEDPRTQFLIATHSPLLLAFPGAQILSFDDGEIQEVKYTDTPGYAIYKAFFRDPTRFVERLFEDG